MCKWHLICFILVLMSLMLTSACSKHSASLEPLPEIDEPQIKKPPYERDLIGMAEYYTVKKGDTLYAIGFRSGYGYHALAQWNGIEPPYKILVGQKIKLFDPEQKVQKISSKSAESAALTSPLDSEKASKIAAKETNFSEKKLDISNDNEKMLKLYWQWPIEGKIVKNFFQSARKGIDIRVSLDASVKAAEAGKVIYSGQGLLGYGNVLIIKHNEMYLSTYGNNSQLLVEEGDVITKGQVIATIDQTANRQPFLHFQIRKNGKPVNPVNYLPKK